jgi:hypothetical protein
MSGLSSLARILWLRSEGNVLVARAIAERAGHRVFHLTGAIQHCITARAPALTKKAGSLGGQIHIVITTQNIANGQTALRTLQFAPDPMCLSRPCSSRCYVSLSKNSQLAKNSEIAKLQNWCAC